MIRLIKRAFQWFLHNFTGAFIPDKPLLSEILKNPNHLLGLSVLKYAEKHLEKDTLNRCSPICFNGKEYFIVLMHPRQRYLMQVSEARIWYKDLSREIRMLKYFER